MDITVRRAAQGDIPRMIDLLYQVHDVHAQGRPDLFKIGAKKYTEEELSEILKDEGKPIFVAEDNGTVLGYAFCVFQPHEGLNTPRFTTLYIDDLCVDESARGKHIGRTIYEYVTAFAKEQGCYNITLNVWTLNEAALGFYKSLGMNVQKYTMEQIL